MVQGAVIIILECTQHKCIQIKNGKENTFEQIPSAE